VAINQDSRLLAEKEGFSGVVKTGDLSPQGRGEMNAPEGRGGLYGGAGFCHEGYSAKK